MFILSQAILENAINSSYLHPFFVIKNKKQGQNYRPCQQV